MFVFRCNNAGFRVRLLGFTLRYFALDRHLRAEINIHTPFWLRILRRNCIYIYDGTVFWKFKNRGVDEAWKHTQQAKE